MIASLDVSSPSAVDAGETWDAVRVPLGLGLQACTALEAETPGSGGTPLVDEGAQQLYFFVPARRLDGSRLPKEAVVLGRGSAVVVPPRESTAWAPHGLRWIRWDDGEHGQGGRLTDACRLQQVLTRLTAGHARTGGQNRGRAGKAALKGIVIPRGGQDEDWTSAAVARLRVEWPREGSCVAVDWDPPHPLPSDLSHVSWVCERTGHVTSSEDRQVLREELNLSSPVQAIRWLHTSLRTFSSFLPQETGALLLEWVGDHRTRDAQVKACGRGRSVRVSITVADREMTWQVSPSIRGDTTTGHSSPRSAA
ncbi:hypothetical protein [Streptomyces roseifaciens]|uniref:hypothetical protein n=1 Tax=Streptomyces roseifaciens TaxID=1488406 RepID=UPI0007180172|nr:hypothetical protein [Streptomyces roseifaciens]